MAVLALLAIAIVAALGGLWLWISGGPNGELPVAFDDRPVAEQNAPDLPGGLPLPPANPESGSAAVDPVGTFDSAEDPRRFDGRGSIRGQVVVDLEVEFPSRYAVLVGPSKNVVGRERAASRRVEFPGTAKEFRIDDLPLGGYDVWVEAEGMNSRRSPLLLTRTRAQPYIILKISPTGFIDGYVLRADGSPAAEVKVTIEQTISKERIATQTRGDGLYRFDDVPDGEYRIIFGPPETPLLPTRELSFTAPSLRFPNATLPATVDVTIHTQDHLGRPISGAVVSGFGDHGGRIELVTDGTGQGWAQHLPPGRYRVTARTDDNLKTRTTLEIHETPDQDFRLILH